MTDDYLYCFARFCVLNEHWWRDDPALLRRVFDAYEQSRVLDIVGPEDVVRLG